MKNKLENGPRLKLVVDRGQKVEEDQDQSAPKASGTRTFSRETKAVGVAAALAASTLSGHDNFTEYVADSTTESRDINSTQTYFTPEVAIGMFDVSSEIAAPLSMELNQSLLALESGSVQRASLLKKYLERQALPPINQALKNITARVEKCGDARTALDGVEGDLETIAQQLQLRPYSEKYTNDVLAHGQINDYTSAFSVWYEVSPSFATDQANTAFHEYTISELKDGFVAVAEQYHLSNLTESTAEQLAEYIIHHGNQLPETLAEADQYSSNGDSNKEHRELEVDNTASTKTTVQYLQKIIRDPNAKEDSRTTSLQTIATHIKQLNKIVSGTFYQFTAHEIVTPNGSSDITAKTSAILSHSYTGFNPQNADAYQSVRYDNDKQSVTIRTSKDGEYADVKFY